MPIGSTGPYYRSIPGNWQRAGILSSATLVNQGITYTAVESGTAGNDITVTIVAGGPTSRALSVAVSGSAITITPATDVAGTITTTQDGVVTAVNASAPASALITATGGGAAVIAALATTSLSGGRSYVIGGARR